MLLIMVSPSFSASSSSEGARLVRRLLSKRARRRLARKAAEFVLVLSVCLLLLCTLLLPSEPTGDLTRANTNNNGSAVW